MLEPENNPNPFFAVDPPRLLRFVLSKVLGRIANTERIESRRAAFEKKRTSDGRAHEVEYFHQLDDPYSHLTAQVVARLAKRYRITLVPHLIRATGGQSQPEAEKLANWARRDAGLVAPHFGLSFPNHAGVVPEEPKQDIAAHALVKLSADEFITEIERISTELWSGRLLDRAGSPSTDTMTAIDEGSARLAELGHYSGATFYYAGEWYWGVDRLFHLEQRLRDLGACEAPEEPYLVPRPSEDVAGVDARGLDLHFYPSLNSPYTSIIFDRTVALASSCNIRFQHKPVLPMIMRGVPATRNKGRYILFDTKREADFCGISFGNLVTPIGTPTRRAYSLLPWAKSMGKDVQLLSTLLRHVWAQGKGLHKPAAMRLAVEEAGLDWSEASKRIGSDDWKPIVEEYQEEMVEGMGLWGVPSYRLTGPDGEPDLEVWGQDRLWLVAAEIRRRAE